MEAAIEAIRAEGTGTTGSRIANGSYSEHVALEREIAEFYGKKHCMAVHQMVFFGAMVAGSLLWGKVANLWGVPTALIVSSVTLAPLTLLAASIRLPGSRLPRA